MLGFESPRPKKHYEDTNKLSPRGKYNLNEGMDNTDMNDLCFVPYKQNKNTLPKLCCCCCCLKLVVTYKETASSVRSGLILKRLIILSVWLRVT